ncbi:MAG: hypothetical protein JW725_02885 [Candidatus Babeliaceae bacterium]|nr:hypothetical protein [Candidatus Babeliaceae bacterium]
MHNAQLIHFSAIGITVVLPIIGVAVGQGFASSMATKALNAQPAAHGAINRLFMVALALTETAAILSTLMAAVMFMNPSSTTGSSLAHIGSAIALAIPAAFIGGISAYPIQAALKSASRQPLISNKIFNLLLLSISMAQTPVIFGLVTGWLLIQQAGEFTGMANGLRLLASGLALGLGSIGPSAGLAIFGKQACDGVGKNREAYDHILSFTFISQAIIETPILLSLVVAMLLLFFGILPPEAPLTDGFVCIAAALAGGFTTFGVGLSSGRTARAACKGFVENLEQYPMISRTSLLAQTLIDTNAVYGLIVAIMLIMQTIH